MTPANSSWILVVEDHSELIQGIRDMMESYGITVRGAETAKAALELLMAKEGNERPGALILDMMLPYGDDTTRDGIAGPGQDENEIGTGLHLLKAMRAHETMMQWRPLWTAVTTARTTPSFLDEIRIALNNCGRIYSKPYDDMRLEYELCVQLGLTCRLHKVFVDAMKGGSGDGP